MDIGERIRVIRKEQKQTQAEFARRLGIGKRTLEDYEANKTRPPAEIISLIADIGRVTTDWLLKGGPRQHHLKLYSEAKMTMGEPQIALYKDVEAAALEIAEMARGYQVGLADDEKELLEHYRRLSEGQKPAVVQIVKALADRHQREGKE